MANNRPHQKAEGQCCWWVRGAPGTRPDSWWCWQRPGWPVALPPAGPHPSPAQGSAGGSPITASASTQQTEYFTGLWALTGVSIGTRRQACVEVACQVGTRWGQRYCLQIDRVKGPPLQVTCDFLLLTVRSGHYPGTCYGFLLERERDEAWLWKPEVGHSLQHRDEYRS